MTFERLYSSVACQQCGFELWEPIAQSSYTSLGLYNDDRFPGRCILSLREHKESLEELTVETMVFFMRDIQIVMKAIRQATNATRVNVAILGNREAHLHAHLIPRFPENEQSPTVHRGMICDPKGSFLVRKQIV